MSTRAHVSSRSVARMTILSLLTSAPRYGYEIRRVIEERQMNQWADISYGSIYPALQRMAKEGLVEAVGTSRTGNLPLRTSYRITKEGREDLLRLLRKAWAEPIFVSHPVDVALSFLNALPEEEVGVLLDARIATLTTYTAQVQRLFDEPLSDVSTLETIRRDILEHHEGLLVAERKWAEQVRNHLTAEMYHGSGSDQSVGSL